MIRTRLKWAALILLAGILAFVAYRQTQKNYYDYIALSGATPLAVNERVPSNLTIEIDGLVKQPYQLTGDALNALATTRIRTREISPEGEYAGAYIYLGIPVFNILEGIAPKKPDHFQFDGPIDILVTFYTKTGETAQFSFNEILMADDSQPVTLAYSRKELLPTNETVQETYTRNIHRENLNGFRLICPKEPDTARYLDNVVRLSYSLIQVKENRLPQRKKKFKCHSRSITCGTAESDFEGRFDGVRKKEITNWIRVGHGHGFDDIAAVSGFELRSFLERNFQGVTADDFFLFVACDGYRALFSGREIFATTDGKDMLIINKLNGKQPEEGFMLAPTKDFFNDRAMWGVSHVVWIQRDELSI